jgi:hypothetical protein
MTSTGLWPLVHQERLRFADLLATLSPDDWASPSLVAETRATAGRTSAPPGPPQVPISEIVVHSEDVARPLGRTMDRAPEALVASLDFYKGAQPLVGAKKRSEGLHLVATDVGWEHGSGPTVSGPAIAVLLAMSGRRAGLDDLTGDGVSTMTARMP